MLESDLRQGLALPADLHSLLGLQRLMEPIGVAPVRHQPSGELIDDHDPPILDDVVGILVEENPRPKGHFKVVQQLDVLRGIHVI